jgi:hypothetical protein
MRWLLPSIIPPEFILHRHPTLLAVTAASSALSCARHDQDNPGVESNKARMAGNSRLTERLQAFNGTMIDHLST